MWRTICASLIVTSGLIIGCNKDSDNSGTTPAPEPVLPSSVKPRPTTQELTQRVKMELTGEPISLMVPPSWELKTLGEALVIEGDTPTDHVGISLGQWKLTNQRNLDASVKVKLLDTEAREDALKFPGLTKGDVVRDISGAHVVERFTMAGGPATTQSTTAPALLAVDSQQYMQWIVTVVVPAPDGFTAYDLKFIGLPLKTYKTDQDFLRGIIDSIAYEPGPSLQPVK